MRVLLAHPTGNQNVRQALRALQDAGLLQEYWTTVAWRESSPFGRLLPGFVVSELSRRTYDSDVLAKTRTRPVRELLRRAAEKYGLAWLTTKESGSASIDRVIQSIDYRVSKRIHERPCDAVYAYEDGAADTFAAAKSLGIFRIYEHPVGHWRHLQQMLEEEAERLPEYRPILGGSNDSESKRNRKELELELANLIIVPSKFAARTVAEARPGAPVEVVNYGCPEPWIDRAQIVVKGQVRALFVGSLQQRKGLSYLIEATKAAGEAVRMTVVGSRLSPCEPVDRWLNSVDWIERLPHHEVLLLMAQHDVLVLPSLSEGFGLVVTEAMSRGLTVIVSENTGAADSVVDGVSGFVVPIRNSEAIAEKLIKLADDHDLLSEMKQASLAQAERLSWQGYRERLITLLSQHCGVEPR